MSKPPTGAKRADKTTVDKASLCHRTTGRFRVRIPARRGDEAFFARARQVLLQHASVREVRANAMTGSLLVLHVGECAEILAHGEAVGLFESTREPPTRQTIAGWLDRLDKFDEDFLWARMDDSPQRAATGLFMLAVLQALRGSILPSAPTLLGEAMRLLRERRASAERSPGGKR